MHLEEKGYKGPCPECGSSDAKHFYPDGQTHCYKCEHHTFPKENNMSTVQPINTQTPFKINTVKDGEYNDILDRKISVDTTKKYKTLIKKQGSMVTHHVYQYFDRNGNHICNKVRDTANKKFWSEGPMTSAGLFGEHIFTQNSTYITISEG